MTKYERSINHITLVRGYMMRAVYNLQNRLLHHDDSKLVEPERRAYEGVDEYLEGVEFGTDEYRRRIKEYLGAALQHHYAVNSHHPEHRNGGIRGMSLFDLIEMLCDLRAVCDDKGKATIDLDVTKRIHGIGDELYAVLLNTLDEMGIRVGRTNADNFGNLPHD